MAPAGAGGQEKNVGSQLIPSGRAAHPRHGVLGRRHVVLQAVQRDGITI